MRSFSLRSVCGGLRLASVLAAVAASMVLCGAAYGQQVQATNFGNAVGGVSIDAQGMLTNLQAAQIGEIRQALAKGLQAAPEGLAGRCELRKLSLRKLDATVAECLREGKPLPDEVLFLGGLQQIRYVLADPETHDVLLVGPAEGWKVSPQGTVVGLSTGRPVMMLDDLITALRAAAGTRSVMSVSIDPTPEGLKRLQAHVRTLQTIGNPQRTAAGIEQQLGPQKITVAGVPESSHFARVMVAADYRMKRISMGLEPSPVAGLTSFVSMSAAGGKGMSNMLPRWWLAPDYEPILRDPDGLAFELRKAGVKTMAEQDFINAAGQREGTKPADPVSQRWADLMTERYADLAQAEPVFGQLRNCMDLAVVAALIVQENLLTKAGLELPSLQGSDGVAPMALDAPKQVSSQASLLKKGRNWMIAAGGVQINPWAIAAKRAAPMAGSPTSTSATAMRWRQI